MFPIFSICLRVTRAEIWADFPYVEDEDITAALGYAARAANNKIAFAAE